MLNSKFTKLHAPKVMIKIDRDTSLYISSVNNSDSGEISCSGWSQEGGITRKKNHVTSILATVNNMATMVRLLAETDTIVESTYQRKK